MLGPDFQLPGASGGTRWKESKSTVATPLPDNWWRLFNDRELTRLVDRALAANNDLAAAKARVETSRALVGLDRAKLFPTLDLTGSAGINRSSADAMEANMPPGANVPIEQQRYRSTFDLAYDLDLWGRNKRAIEASSAQAAAAEALLDSQRLGIAHRSGLGGWSCHQPLPHGSRTRKQRPQPRPAPARLCGTRACRALWDGAIRLFHQPTQPGKYPARHPPRPSRPSPQPPPRRARRRAESPRCLCRNRNRGNGVLSEFQPHCQRRIRVH